LIRAASRPSIAHPVIWVFDSWPGVAENPPSEFSTRSNQAGAGDLAALAGRGATAETKTKTTSSAVAAPANPGLFGPL